MDLDLSEIPGESVHKAIYEVIENNLQSKKFKLTVSSASKAGENNFLGVVYRVSFNRADDSVNGSKSSIIVKVAPQNETQRTQFRSRDMFLQEIFLYNEVLPFFRQFEQSKGITMENSFTEYPICYQTLDEEPTECVLLEDMSVRGFSIIDRYTEEVTPDHVYLFMQALGKFHALSFALKDQQPQKFQELASNLKEFFQTDDLNVKDSFNQQTKSITAILKNDEDAHLLIKVESLYVKDPIVIALECVDSKLAGSASVIAYGDAWQNNTMFRYDEQRKPIEISLLDWQESRHSTPIIDLAKFIFCCTTKQVRDAHYDNFLKTYHDTLSAHIRRLGSDPEQLFPYNLMQEHLRRFGKIGMILASVVLPVLTAEKGNGIDIDKMAENMANNEKIDTSDFFFAGPSRDRFNERMKGVVIDMARLGYI